MILSQRVKREQLAEEMRVLYVAMTRAKRKLILTACVTRPEEKLGCAPERPMPWQVIRCNSPVQWLLMGEHRALKTSIHDREPFLGGASAAEQQELPPFDPVVLAAIEEKLGWTYAHAEAIRLNAKAAVSKIGARTDTPPEFRMPAFLGKTTSAVFSGTAIHAAMQYLPLESELDAAGARAFLAGLVAGGRIAPEQAEAADAEAIAWFTRESLFARMRAAERLERELPFSYPAEAQLLYQVDADERVLLQGVVDACFVENGGWTIVDYKTDRVRPGETAVDAAMRHGQQLKLYALALEAITGIPVKEKLVVLLSHRAVVGV